LKRRSDNSYPFHTLIAIQCDAIIVRIARHGRDDLYFIVIHACALGDTDPETAYVYYFCRSVVTRTIFTLVYVSVTGSRGRTEENYFFFSNETRAQLFITNRTEETDTNTTRSRGTWTDTYCVKTTLYIIYRCTRKREKRNRRETSSNSTK